MGFFNKIFGKKSNENQNELTAEEKDLTEDDIIQFNTNAFPKELRNKGFYFLKYYKEDGEWMNKGDLVCEIRIGEFYGSLCDSATVSASSSGYLEHCLKKDDLVSDDSILFNLHKQGEYKNENSSEKPIFKSYFYLNDYKKEKDTRFISLEIERLVEDGTFVEVGTPIFQFQLESGEDFINKSKKSGFVYFNSLVSNLVWEDGMLIYYVNNNDDLRIKQRFKNEEEIIIDEFRNSKIIKWRIVSSLFPISEGIKMISDDGLLEFLFTLNYQDGKDNIIFHFNPKQIRPRVSDKVLFLFENGQQIQFEIISNPTSTKNILKENILEYKSLITSQYLELFSNYNLKKWKIDLINDKKEYFGGEIGGDENYKSQNNLQIAIKKFVVDYTNIVKKVIGDYHPIDLNETIEIGQNEEGFCFVYLMHDTINNFYKIGISNNPEYRERTLQSEKPTIELIISKRFPVRKIAESFEKALHATYSEKRLRGEWFDLDQNDVANIKESLS